jgi:hypothetical protein
MKTEFSHHKMTVRNSARFWSAPALWRFCSAQKFESGRGLPQSKTLPRQSGFNCQPW